MVAMTDEARLEFLMPCSMPRRSERIRSEMISPAGSSAPRFSRRPVDRLCSRSSSSLFCRSRFARAQRLGTFGLIPVMAIHLEL